MNLGNGLGIGSLDKRTRRELIVAQYLLLFTTARFQKERLEERQIDAALLQISLMVGMKRADDINFPRERQVLIEGMLHTDSATQISRVGTSGQHMVTIGCQLKGRIIARTYRTLRRQVIADASRQGILCSYSSNT